MRLAAARTPQALVHVARGLVAGLDYLHNHPSVRATVADKGVLHRDIKPANVLLGPGDVPVLMDFGSAAVANPTHLTLT